jgi:hypothetical protein
LEGKSGGPSRVLVLGVPLRHSLLVPDRGVVVVVMVTHHDLTP